MGYAASEIALRGSNTPVPLGVSHFSGAAVRPSARQRRRVRPRLWPHPAPDGLLPDHPYVHRYWSMALGSRPMAELLRLITAAQRGESIRQPVFLAVLAREGLAAFGEDAPGGPSRCAEIIWVRDRLPPLGAQQVSRLAYELRRRHTYDLALAAASQQAGRPRVSPWPAGERRGPGGRR